MNKCRCGKELSHSKYTQCNSCSKLGRRNNLQYSEDMASKDNPLYPLYRSVIHFKDRDPNVDVRETVKHLLASHSEEELLGSMLFRKDVDKPFSKDNYRLSRVRDYRGMARKTTKPTSSIYVGVAKHTAKSGLITWEATWKRKYIKGSAQSTEYEAARVREEYIIANDLLGVARLNFSHIDSI